MTNWVSRGRRWQGRGYSLIREFRQLQKRKKVIRRSNPTQLTSEDITTALRTLKGYRSGTWQRINLDNKYWSCTKNRFQDVVDENKINERTYVVDKFDCDNFAFAFKAQVAMNYNLNNVGLVIDHSGGHAYNVVVFQDGSAELFEPQNDRWISPGESKQYSFKRGIVIF